MKIVVLSQALTPQYGGSAVSEASLCTALQKRFATEVLCRRGAVDEAFVREFGLTGVKQYDPFEVVRAWRDSRHWISQTLDGADIVHINGHWRWENAFFARLCRKRKVPYLLQPRGMLWVGHRKVWAKRLFNRWIGNSIVGGASRLVALSEFETLQWEPYAIPPERIVIQPNGISEFKGSASKLSEHPFFLYFGRLETRKNVPILLAAFDRYAKDGGEADLLLIGPVEHSYDNVLKKQIAQAGLGRRVRILPPVYGEAKRSYLKQAIAVVYPAYQEPFGRVPFETLIAGGVPVVPEQSGSAEYLRRYLEPCLYAIDDPDALAAALRRVEHGHIPDLEARRQRALAWVRQELKWDSVVERVIEIYREVLSEGPLPDLQTRSRVVPVKVSPLLQREVPSDRLGEMGE